MAPAALEGAGVLWTPLRSSSADRAGRRDPGDILCGYMLSSKAKRNDTINNINEDEQMSLLTKHLAEVFEKMATAIPPALDGGSRLPKA